MTGTSDWLPPLETLAQHDGDWPAYLDAIYAIFRVDFVDSKPNYPGKRCALKRHPVELGKEATFWHLISEGKVEADRLPDLRRCERIRWPRPMIEAVETGRVRVWRNQRKNAERIVIATDDFSYVVILEDRDEYVLPWTVYYVEQLHRRDKLRKEYEASLPNP